MNAIERVVSPEPFPYEEEADLRPYKIADYVGQNQIKEVLEMTLVSAKKRLQPMDHILLYGPPGLGKTTLGYIVASELGSNFHRTTGPALERGGDLAAILSEIKRGDVLFIDEIHRLNYVVEEMLYSVMEDFNLDIVIGKGPSARTISLSFPQFTLIGATTRAGMLSSPLRDRFGLNFRLNFYLEPELKQILRRASDLLKIEIDEGALQATARRSRGTPRIALRLLKRERDYAVAKGFSEVNEKLALDCFKLLNIDDLGLDEIDRKYLQLIYDQFNGGPAGVEAISHALGEDRRTVEEVLEPYLLQEGLIIRSNRGRILTPSGYKHLGLEPIQKNLF